MAPLLNEKGGMIDNRYTKMGFKIAENTLMDKSFVYKILYGDSAGHIYNYDFHYKTDEVY